MATKPLLATIVCFSLSLFIVPSASAGCACMCVDAEPMSVCTGFIDSQRTTLECAAVLDCPALTDTGLTEPEITTADNPNVPPGVACRPRHLWRPDLGEYTVHNICRPVDLVASSGKGKGKGN